MKKKLLFPLLGLALMAATSCKKDDTEEATTLTYSIPTTYNFTNVNYSDATTRIAMHGELDTELKKGQTSGVAVSSARAQGMFTNTGNYFTSATLNSSSLQIKNFVAPDAQAVLTKFIDSVCVASQSSVAYSNGVAGVAVGVDPTKKYLLNSNGIEYYQVVTKMLLVDLYFYNIKYNYFSAAGIGASVDNTTVINGQGTDMQHAWDMAFGLFGVPTDFPTNVTGVKYIGNYSNQVNPALGSNAIIMNAFLYGRAAINNNDHSGKNAQASVITLQLEKVIGASIIREMNAAKNNVTDVAVRHHYLSEALGFIYGLQTLPSSQLDSQIPTILSYFGTNIYNMNTTQMNSVIDAVSTVYGLDDVKSTL